VITFNAFLGFGLFGAEVFDTVFFTDLPDVPAAGLLMRTAASLLLNGHFLFVQFPLILSEPHWQNSAK